MSGTGEQTRCRVKITGTFRGRPFEYVDPPDSEGSQFLWLEDPDDKVSEYWWTDGNFGCDCNRARFVNFLESEYPELFEEKSYGAMGAGVTFRCGHEILIDAIVPLDPALPALILNESTQGNP